MNGDCKAPKCDRKFKVLLIGNSAVGKTSIVWRYINNRFSSNTSFTLECSFQEKQIEVDRKRVNLQIWDTAGQERFQAITKAFYRDAHGVILVYDVSNPDSFDALPRWLNDIEASAPVDVALAIIGNKSDLTGPGSVNPTTATKYASFLDVPFRQVSAKTGTAELEEIFTELTGIMIERFPQATPEKMAKKIVPSTSPPSRSCC